MSRNVPAWPSGTRRRLLAGAGAAAAAALLRPSLLPAAEPDERAARQADRIALFNTHTSETVEVAFRSSSGFVQPALEQLDRVLRDHRTNEVHAMDPALFVLLADLAEGLGLEARYQIISGYRSPASNAKLRAASKGVAEKSLHMQGRAMDVRLEHCPCAKLRDAALKLQRGGVGYYARSDFVHLDTGRVRTWEG